MGRIEDGLLDTGRSIKASDLSVLDGCHRCHEVFDRRATMSSGALISDEEWTFYVQESFL